MAGLGSEQLEHVIVVALENRSFDHLLGYLDHPDPSFDGVKEGMANPLDPSQPDLGQVPVAMHKRLRLRVDPDHAHEAAVTQLGMAQGKEPTNNGFVHSYEEKCVGSGPGGRRARRAARVFNAVAIIFILAALVSLAAGRPWLAMVGVVVALVVFAVRLRAVPRPDFFPGDGPRIMWCWSPSSIPGMAALAKSFAVCNRWFCSVPGETWPNRQFLHAATSAGTVDIVAKPYFDHTIFELLEEHGSDWRIYFDGPAQVLCYPALWHHPARQVNWRLVQDLFRDIDGGTLATYSFVEPNHGYSGRPYSQHPGNNKRLTLDFRRADRFIAGIYEALRNKPELFEKTLLVVTWDEHGGTFDHVPPPAAVPPDQRPARNFDFRRYGPRVPALIVSPWIASATVDGRVYDHASVPASLRARFASEASPLTERDRHANTFLDLLSLQSPRQGDALPDLSGHAWRPRATLSWVFQLVAWFRGLLTGEEPFHRTLARLAAAVDREIEPETPAAVAPSVVAGPMTGPELRAQWGEEVLPPVPDAPRRTSARATRTLAHAGTEP